MQSSGQMTEHSVFLVTGASKGLGRAICELLATKGYTIVGLARESVELIELDNYLKSHNSSSCAIVCDLSQPKQIDKVANAIITQYPSINGIIHNAGIIGPVGNIFTVDEAKWNETLVVNLVSVQQLTRILYPAMVNAGRCRVTTISSGAAVNSLESWSAYCTSKAGLDMWTRCLADEGKSDGISAVSIAPGIVDTDMQATIRSADKADFPMVDRFIQFHKNGDLVAPEKVANTMIKIMVSHPMEQSGKRFDVRDL
ncbi:MAG TPA: SDR family NAD(P)-dependent oxidoreductase [Candidatus Poseidoniales archaeon]|nr:MAG TPA: SDR family NAD(P)-dependent oxidoreductase [Candidatus Poseidoniales archaeon]